MVMMIAIVIIPAVIHLYFIGKLHCAVLSFLQPSFSFLCLSQPNRSRQTAAQPESGSAQGLFLLKGRFFVCFLFGQLWSLRSIRKVP